MQNASNVRFVDKMQFIIGVLGLQMSLFLLGYSPRYGLLIWNLVVFVPMMVHKVFYFTHMNKQLFFVDFCYFAQILMYAYLYIWPDSRQLYLALFSFSCGTMGHSITQFRNTYAFHDLDRLSSLLLHVVPLKTFWALRWLGSDDDRWGLNTPTPESVEFWEFFKTPIPFYVGHQVFFCVMFWCGEVCVLLETITDWDGGCVGV